MSESNRIIKKAAKAAMHVPLHAAILPDDSQDGNKHLGYPDAVAVVKAILPTISREAEERERRQSRILLRAVPGSRTQLKKTRLGRRNRSSQRR